MKISLENYLRNKLDEVESMHSFELATDTIRCWIDEYNEQLHQCNVSGRSEQLCRTFFPDGKTTSATKCQFCGKEKWEH